MKTKRATSPAQTEQIGFELGLLLKDEPHVVILLEGPLGAGKTTFAKGIARGIGITEIVNSPTFVIMKKYMAKNVLHTMVHLDLYRLDHLGDDFDLEEYVEGDGIVVIEWPYNIKELLPRDHLLVSFEIVSDDVRNIRLECVGYPCKRAVASI
ncbi:MAG: tRNA (adenosine(37)-N6)-threonylcarbamoyltransferase complex ATPase subunit type 1 TsaE [Acholeplasmataceae bacterium]|nr:tRNA (adenosine(37)-N6)-threonylcarbamoyltransferase complex ATPase subunit type 1 TsaE [Acholeplasmataceae bacterium]